MKRTLFICLAACCLFFVSVSATNSYTAGYNFRAEAASGKVLADTGIEILQKRIAELNISGLTVTALEFIHTDSFKVAGVEKPMTGLPAFCRVAATIKPAPESNIRIELWLPQQNWNGRFLGTGNGGGAGSIKYSSLADGLKKGYATANTDMGTSPNADAAVDHPERWADFGYRATHLMTVVSKAILKVYYHKAQHHAYFVGCSTGGQQALMEAQRYPADYNGIIAGAPANNRTHLHTDFLLNHKLTHQTGGALFSAANLAFITNTILAQFAGKDGGAPGDNFLTDPRLAKFDPETLFACKGTGNDSCLTGVQIAALKSIYAGPVNPKSGEQIYTSFPAGSENSGGGLESQQTVKGIDGLIYLYKWVFGQGFDYAQFDFDKDQAKLDAVLAPLLNANNPDLNPLKKLGGKLIMFSGTADPLVPCQDAINYYDRVVHNQGNNLKQTQDFFRYFLVPGMGHCAGGPGPNDFGQNLGSVVRQDSEHNILLALVKWVEQGAAPEHIIANGLNCCSIPKASPFQRPLYPYPKFPGYMGGDVNKASSYKGVVHQMGDVLVPAKKYLK